jgi:hypothetical protein
VGRTDGHEVADNRRDKSGAGAGKGVRTWGSATRTVEEGGRRKVRGGWESKPRESAILSAALALAAARFFLKVSWGVVWVAGSGETKMPFLAVPRVRPRGTARSHTTYLDRPAGRTWTGLVRRSTSTTISRFRDGYVHISSIFKECRQPSIFSSPAREITVFVSKPLPTG